MRWIFDPALGTKHSEVTDIWLLTSEELIGCFVQKLVKINTIDDMACSINGFRPELSWSLVFIKHHSGHLNKCSVLAFDDAILLWRVRGREFMCDAQGIKICIKASVLEFSAIVTSDVLYLGAKMFIARLAKRLKTSCTSVL